MSVSIRRSIATTTVGVTLAALLSAAGPAEAAAFGAAGPTSTRPVSAMLPSGTRQAAGPESAAPPAADVPRTATAAQEHRTPASKKVYGKVGAGQSRTSIHVKFVDGAQVRLRGGKLASLAGQDLEGARSALAPGRVRTLAPLFVGGEEKIAADVAETERRSGRRQADLNGWYRVQLTPGADLEATLAALNALDEVEVAYAEPKASPLPVSPSFTGLQGYHSIASSSGIDANYARTVPGGGGANVRVLDIEYSWNGTHEDLSRLRTSFVANGTSKDPFGDRSHGTAVVGELVGDPNAYGVTGLVPDAGMLVTNSYNVERGLDIANAIMTASSVLSAGDVMLIEQQSPGPGGACGKDQVGCVPVEWWPAHYDAIVHATSKGIIVVEAAGNGWQNLDAAMYGSAFPAGRADSGAIIVGAGGAPGCRGARTKLDFSNYGRRVDLQGWGECVTTTGYGDLQGGAENQWYTRSFGGTSSASPIVAAAAASLSSIAEQRGIRLAPRDVRARLKATGTAQVGTGGNIGPLPNLRAAIGALGTTTDTTAPIVSAVQHFVPSGYTAGPTVPVTFRWTASDPSGVSQVAAYLSVNGGAWVQQTLSSAAAGSVTLSLTPGTSYRMAVAARDGAGNWSGYAYSATTTPGLWQENSGSITFSTGWTQSAWASASGGALRVSSTPNASASFTFTGTNVAWVGTRAANRGKAHIYLDGVYRQTIDLYAASTSARTVLASYSWPTAGPHTMKVVVVGTTGRPTIDVDAFVRLA